MLRARTSAPADTYYRASARFGDADLYAHAVLALTVIVTGVRRNNNSDIVTTDRRADDDGTVRGNRRTRPRVRPHVNDNRYRNFGRGGGDPVGYGRKKNRRRDMCVRIVL